MSERYGKPSKSKRTKNNPNRLRSKNNPKGRRKDPEIDWKKYNEHRRAEGENHREWMRRIADQARKRLGMAPGTRDTRVSAILCSIVKSNGNLSYWGLYNHFAKHPEDLELCELKRQYSRSWHHLRISEIDPVVLQWLLPWMAGDEAKGDLLADSSGYSMGLHEDWRNAKYGDISVRQFRKLHIIHTPHGKICAATVTEGHASDSPQLRKMTKFLPHGSGYLIADRAYIGKKNCQAVKDTGRNPIMRLKSNTRAKGFNALSDMVKFSKEHPGTFFRLVGIRNNVESVFSSMKERFGAAVRAVGDRTSSIELLSMAICYNMVA